MKSSPDPDFPIVVIPEICEQSSPPYFEDTPEATGITMRWRGTAPSVRDRVAVARGLSLKDFR